MTLNFGRANETYRVEALDLPPLPLRAQPSKRRWK